MHAEEKSQIFIDIDGLLGLDKLSHRHSVLRWLWKLYKFWRNNMTFIISKLSPSVCPGRWVEKVLRKNERAKYKDRKKFDLVGKHRLHRKDNIYILSWK